MDSWDKKRSASGSVATRKLRWELNIPTAINESIPVKAEYKCTLHRLVGSSVSGRLYIFQDYFGFKSISRKGVTVSEPLYSIESITLCTLALFSTGICVKMGYGQAYCFTGFSSRKECFELLSNLQKHASEECSIKENVNKASWRSLSQTLSRCNGDLSMITSELSLHSAGGSPSRSQTEPSTPSTISSPSTPIG